jgi:hypothetical protein
MADIANSEPVLTEDRNDRKEITGDNGLNHQASQHSMSNETKPEKGKGEERKAERPSKAKQIWAKIGLDKGTVMMMFKGSVAPAVALAFYQADSVSCIDPFPAQERIMSLTTL